jgi:hypothetical protein
MSPLFYPRLADLIAQPLLHGRMRSGFIDSGHHSKIE